MVFSLDKFSTYQSIPQAFFELAKESLDSALYEQSCIQADGSRPWVTRTFGESKSRIERLVDYLGSIGVVVGSKVAIISNTRPEWLEADLAVLSLGAVSVSVYPSLTAEEVGYILFDSQAKIVFAENEEQLAKVEALLAAPCQIPATEERAASISQIAISRVITFEECAQSELVTSYSKLLETQSKALPRSLPEIKSSALATLVYTSGTTGPPKGVMQSHGNHLANVRQAFQSGMITPENSIMLFLPLAHSFAKLMGYLGFLSPLVLKFPAVPNPKSSKLDQNSIARDIRESGAEVIPLVPRMLEKMQAGVISKANKGGFSALPLKIALWAAREQYRRRKEGKVIGLLVQIAFDATGAVREKIKAALFGPKFLYAISGGAKLSRDVAEFFAGLGIEVLEGYGLTETCVATNVNRPGKVRIGTVGPVLAFDIEQKIAEDGEILYRGPNVALGYYNRPTATKQSWDSQGWFHTGDLGEVSEDGYLSIVGRKKELIVTSYGKKIATEDVEQKLKASNYISQVVLLGDDRAYCTALLTLEIDSIEKWAAKQNLRLNQPLTSDPQVEKLIGQEIERINTGLASYESVKRFKILPEELTAENGFLTPTFKIKRKVVLKAFEKEIEELYRE